MRPRKKDRHLPPCVYLKHGAYWLVKKGKWTRLGAELPEALQSYAKAVAPEAPGMPGLIDRMMPFVIKGKAPSTVLQYNKCAALVRVVFKDRSPEQIKHGDVVQMMDAFNDRPVIANRMLTVLRMVFVKALDRGLVEADPTIRVTRFDQAERDRLITDGEYKAIYGKAPAWLQVIMDLCYLTGQRIGDVLTLERSQLLDEGIYFKQQKTGNHLIVGWTPQLRTVIKTAGRLSAKMASLRYVVPGRGGKLRHYHNVYRAFKTAAERAGIKNVTLHDLRAKAGTDAERQGLDPTALLGHKSAKTTQSYLRDKRAKVVAGPKKAAK